MVFLGSTPIGGPLLGAIVDAFGARTGVMVGGVAALAAAAWGWEASRRRTLREGADEVVLEHQPAAAVSVQA
jgi:hypothetical protein